jgi:putative DNA primase/helicase
VAAVINLDLEQPSDTAADIVFAAAHAVYFLDAVYGEVNSGRLGLSVMKSNGQWGRSEHFQWLRFAAAWADQQDQTKPAAIYFRATMLPPEGIKSGRGGEADSHALAFLWGDVDYGTVGHKPPPGAALPPDEDAARKVIAGLPTPFLIINSGGGLYPIWKFERPIFITNANRAEVKTRSQQWQNLIAAKTAELGWHYGSGVGDLARVLRLPGSVNRKVPELERPCRVIAVSGEVLPTW